jgi:hypothetical protein
MFLVHFLIALSGLLLPSAVHAFSLSNTGWDCTGFLYCNPGAPPPADVVTIMTVTIVNGVAAFIGALAVVVFLYGAIRMVTSQGQEGKEAGKKALIYASLGLAAALLVSAIVAFVRDYIYYLGS